MTYPDGTYERFEHAGVVVEIVQDTDGFAGNPQDNDNAGTLYSWTRDFDGDESIYQPDTISGRPYELADATYEEDRATQERAFTAYFAENYDAALTVPLRFSDYGSSGARLYLTDAEDANCALCFTAEEIESEWSGHVDLYLVQMKDATGSPTGETQEYGGARRYAEARVSELDEWMQGNVFGIVIRERTSADLEEDDDGDVLESVWGFIGDPLSESGKYIYEEARSMAEGCAQEVESERQEAFEMACRDIATVG